MALDGNARYCYLSPREGTRLIVAECCRNLAVAGAEPVGATNNLNFGNPERPEVMAQLVESIEGMAEACRHFDVPITGGNVSLYNETLGEGIWPTPVIGVVGRIKTAAPVTITFKSPDREILLVGGLGRCDLRRFGGTQYAKVVLKDLWGLSPELDLDYEKRAQAAVRDIVRAGLAESAHDLSDGGLAVALAECSFGGVGCSVDLAQALGGVTELRPEFLLFHEGPSRVLISTAQAEKVEAIASRYNVESPRIGVTTKDRLRIRRGGDTLIDVGVLQLRDIWEQALEKLLEHGRV